MNSTAGAESGQSSALEVQVWQAPVRVVRLQGLERATQRVQGLGTGMGSEGIDSEVDVRGGGLVRTGLNVGAGISSGGKRGAAACEEEV